MKFESKVIHREKENDSQYQGTATPVFRSSSYAYNTAEEIMADFSAEEHGFMYTRIGNPTVAKLQEALCELSNGIGCICFASGMAAVSSAVHSLIGSGSNIVSSITMFGNTAVLFDKCFKRFNVEIRWFTPGNEDNLDELIDEDTACVFTEVVGNPKMDFADIAKIAEISHKHNVPLLVDATVTPPGICDFKKFGADVIIHSTTKYISGHSRAIGGAVIDTGNFDWNSHPPIDVDLFSNPKSKNLFIHNLVDQYLCNYGPCMAPDVADITLQGLETLAIRLEKISNNTMEVAKALQKNAKVLSVSYPGLPDDPFHCVAAKYCENGLYSGFMAFDVGTRENAFKVLNKLKMIKIMTNLGDTRTLVIHPESTIYDSFSQEDQLASGVTPGLIRVSIGIENVEDILADFIQALG